LNHPLVKLTFYMLLEGVERFALDMVKPQLTNEYLEVNLGKDRFGRLKSTYKNAGDAGQSLINYLNIADILRLARRAGIIEIEESVILSVKDARNGAAHVSENLVSKYGDVKKLAQVRSECLRVLRSS
jgi:hypothetical protein